MLFNIYYTNFAKVYEIKMIISDIIHIGGSFESGEEGQTDVEFKATIYAEFLNLFKGLCI
ncbi:TPA: hypothetical protein PTV43_002948 [Clostridium botulinum]|nr:hypothetical protein [Clostridium botulinum]